MSRPQSVQTRIEEIIFPTYLPAAPDKNPMFLEKRVYQGSSGKVYPLPFTDRIAEKPVNRKWKAIWIENEFLRAMVLPELGGRIHLLQDKTNGYDLIYNQSVIKPALVGLAGPWASGGIEFNWPQHHRPATFLPVDFKIEKNSDGSQTIWCSDHDPMTRMKGMHGVCLHPGKAYLELKVRAYNRTPLTQTFLWWANVATRVNESYQSFFPPDVAYVADHAKRAMSEYPLAKGFYYGVNYGERGRKGIPANEIPSQFIPPHCNSKSAIGNRQSAIPNYAANDLSFYANIPVPTSYMCMGSKEDFFGGYDHAAQAGIVHIANHHISPGKKQWTWGNHDFGYAWDRNLTDKDARGEFAPYIEIMAGVYTDNQPDFSFLQPGETKTWSQHWYPIQKIGPAQHANLDAAISFRRSGGRQTAAIQIGVSVTSACSKAKIIVEQIALKKIGGVPPNAATRKKLFATTRDLTPGNPFVREIKLPRGIAETDLVLRVTDEGGNEIISYQPKPRANAEVPAPATEPPPPEKISSADELFITGLHLEQYRHATRCPTLYWREALRRDPSDSRCNNAMGSWHLKRGEFTVAEKFFRAAIERQTSRNPNPPDGEAYYNLGLTLRYLGRYDEAYDAFYKSVWNQAWMAAGYHALSEIDCCRKNFATALEHLNRSLRFDTGNLRARNLKAIVLRQLNRETEAKVLLRETLELDPLDWWARHLNGEELKCDLQTALDIAHDFTRAGFFAEAIGLIAAQSEIIGLAESQGDSSHQPRVARNELPWVFASVTHNPEGVAATGDITPSGLKKLLPPFTQGSRLRANPGLIDAIPLGLPDQSWGAAPLLFYTLAWLKEQLGDERAAQKHFKRAAALPPDYCFPSRLEEIAILESAMRANPKDAKAPYYLGNLLYDRRRHNEAIRLWEKSAKLDGNFSIVWRNLGIGYFNIRKNFSLARTAYDKAFRVNPSDARLLYERDQLWKRLGEKPSKRLRELEKFPQLVSQRDDLSVELCALLNQTGRHVEAMQLLAQRNFQPWEGGEGGPLGQHVRTQLALGREALQSPGRARHSVRASLGKPDRGAHEVTRPAIAIAHFRAALTVPKNLGEAKHLLANQSDIRYWLGCALDLAREKSKAKEHWLAAANFKGDFQDMSVRAFSEMTFYSALAWKKLGQPEKAKKLLRELLTYAKQLQKSEAKIDYFATSLPTMLIFDDDLQFRQETTALFLQTQASLGLGQDVKARKLLRLVLKRDPNHALASDLMKELS